VGRQEHGRLTNAIIRNPALDKIQLLAKIEQLSQRDRTAFAAAIAERMLAAYAKFSNRTGKGNPSQLRDTLSRLWSDLEGNALSEAEVDRLINASDELIPGEDDRPWVPEQPAAEDAASAVIYALRSRRSGLAQEAAWAATRACDALDDFVVNHEDIDTNVPESMSRVLAHPLIQAELARQQRDLEELLQGSATVQGLRERSKAEAPQFLPLNGSSLK
jgi:uncharacterized protein YjaG (DUF416 family)